jgi:WD40 repeat protein
MLLVDQPTTTLAGGSSATITSSLRFSPDGKLLLAVGDNGNSKLWGTDDWKIIPADPKSRTGLQSGWFIKSGAFSPDSKLLACVEGESFEFLKIWNLDSSPLSLAGQARMAGRNNINWHDAIWTKNGDTLITRGPKGRLKCWGKKGSTGTVNVAVAGTSIIGDGRPKERHFGVNSVHCSPDGKLLATAFEHGIQIWSIPSGQEVRWIGRPQPESQWVYHSLCGFSPDGKMLAATLERNSSKETDYKGVELIRLWDTSTWNEAGTLDGANAGGINFKFRAFSPDSRLVMSTAGSTWNNTVAIWDAASGAKLQQFKTTSIGNVVFGPDSTMLVTGGHDYLLNNRLYNVNIWNAQTGQLTTRISDLTISTVAVSPDGKWVATGCGENEIKLWNLSNGKRVPYRDEYDANKGNVTSSKGDGNGGTITADQYRSIQPGTLRFAVHKTIGKPYDYKHDFSTRTNRGQSGTNFGTSAVNTFKEYYSLKGHPDKVAEFLYEGPSTNPPLQRTGIRQRQ